MSRWWRKTVTATEIASGAITAAKLATDAVETAKINALAVTAAKIAAGAVETAKFAAGAVDAAALASDAVTTAKILAANVTVAKLGVDVLQVATIAVSSAELLALNTTPKTLVASPGANKVLVLHSIFFNLDFNAAAYDGVAAGEDLTVKYTNGSGLAVATVEATGFLDQASDQFRAGAPVVPTTDASATFVAAAALVLHMASGNIATGDSPLYVRIYYRTIDTNFTA